MHDVIIVGGSYAGMAAALQLLRAYKAVLIIDAGERRNRFAAHAHGFLGEDGTDPGEIARKARRQLEAYPNLDWVDGRATEVAGTKDAFTVTAAGKTFSGRRLLFATGVHDALPPVKGLSERWGVSVYHCPYCHGYELGRGAIGVIGANPMSGHQAEVVSEWGPTTLFTNAVVPIETEQRGALEARGVTIEETPIATLVDHAGVLLTDGRRLDFAGLFTAPRNSPASPLAETLGCALEETGFGLHVRTDSGKRTTVPGVFACGDTARVPHSISLAVADGAWAGAQIHFSLIHPDT
ncbi:NAD(P)/FAD-dependent oxidoreductase [Acuticoccus sp. M5D2P5]|uniref:NAD(P)/FAD-dependent oxidoreductase n=1 Tax=Acuticoccus kalidii TaxID=2910977 RepID=UPI001F296F8B|nr:NAD(P)/FAD-dependent oxidoreductase [Acuticoccus kalidii]MCF3932005.1 NAD(P)/FAD-dependent oxidoreductase [Acuticoccus kalidii]